MSRFVLGLTGSIAMGKTTVSNMFRNQGVPVWCADSAVKELYSPEGQGTKKIRKIFPSAVDKKGVSKKKLKKLIHKDNKVLETLEKLIHPLLNDSKNQFLKDHKSKDLIVFDIPLLFEKGQEDKFDATLLVTASEETQRERALSRPNLSIDDFEFIKKNQLKETEKIGKATFVFFTDKSIEKTNEEVKSLYKKITNKDMFSS